MAKFEGARGVLFGLALPGRLFALLVELLLRGDLERLNAGAASGAVSGRNVTRPAPHSAARSVQPLPRRSYGPQN